MKKVIVPVLAVVVFGQLLAQAMRTHTDRKAGFSIRHPVNWTKTVNNSDGSNVTLATQDQLVVIQVMRTNVPKGITADAFLQEVEKHIGETHVNQLPEEKRHARPEHLRSMNADEASAGYYDLDHEGHKIHQLIMVMRKATRIYTVMVTFADAADEEVKNLAIQVADSFKIL
ncbi:MAG: photosystem II reaction center PsbP family protein [Turneriella sp.]|nr:photosystem II reaction center PsbP family protein [Turneriella sp.]